MADDEEYKAIQSEKSNHHRVTPEGVELGVLMAQLSEIGAKKLKADDDKDDDRCQTCAYRKDTVPNGCVQTQLDSYKCLMEGDRAFRCHCKKDGEYPLCDGWVSARIGKKLMGIADTKVDYQYSHDLEKELQES